MQTLYSVGRRCLFVLGFLVVRGLLVLCLLVVMCLMAGIYGALHNQISYTVSPEYFHACKFEQFSVNNIFHNRLGASVVGVLASWWMGLLCGLPVLVISCFAKTHKALITSAIRATICTIAVGLLAGILALIIGFFTISTDDPTNWCSAIPLNDPTAFKRAGMMHNFSYMGARIGLLVGLVWSIYTVIMSWRKARPK